MGTKLSTLFLFAVLIIGIASYPNVNLNSNLFDEPSLNPSLLVAFADSEDDEDGDSSGDEDGDSSGDEDGDSSGDEDGDSSGDEDGDSSGDEDGDSSGDEDGDSSGDEDGDSSGDEDGDSSGDEDGDSSGDSDNALKSIEDATEEIEKAEIKIDEAFNDGKDILLSEEKLAEARELLEQAESSFDDGNFDDAEELAEEAKDLASESRMKFIGKSLEDFEDDDFEVEHEDDEDEIKIKAEVEDGVAKVKVKFDGDKHKFLVTDNPSEDAIADAILELPNFPLDKAGIIEIWDFEVKHEDDEDEIEIEVEVEDGVAKVEVEFNDQKHRFVVTDDTSEDAIANAILELPNFPLDKAGIIEIWDFEVEEEDEFSSLTTTEYAAYESQQQSQELYDDLQQKINELEERIQDLLEKYESGEYYGKVHEIDSEIISYVISFTGFGVSHDDDSVSSMKGTIYIDSLITGSSISKYSVTGGDISIGDVFYDFVFGKVRVTSSGNVVLIGQVMNWADENDDSSTIKLVIHSDVPLEDGFGSESLNIEILPQSQIAGLWFLSGTGSLELTGSVEPVETQGTIEPNVTETEDTVEDIPHTTTISVSTLQESYVSGDEIVISGTVAEIFENTPVVLQTVTASDLIDIAQINLSSNGEFTHSIQAIGPQWQTSDTYTVKAFYGGNNFAQTTFEFSVE